MTGGSPLIATVEVGVILAPTLSKDELEAFANRLTADVAAELERATDRSWRFHTGEQINLENNENRSGADFVGEASLRLAEGSFDLMIVITDLSLMSTQNRLVSGLASPLTRICILSTRQLRTTGRGPDLPLDSPQVRWNGATLLLNLIGRVLGASHNAEKGAMARFVLDSHRTAVEPYRPPEEVREYARRFTEGEYRVSGPLSVLKAHILSLFHFPRLVFPALVRNRAPFLALRLPGLAAAAVAPVFLLVFTAEFWDAGLGMTNTTAATYALISIAAATIYLSFSQRLFLPRKESPDLPKHLAAANVVIFATILLAIIGLFIMLVLISLAIETWVFPQGLISTWPTLRNPVVTLLDKTRLAAFISTVGVTTGALAGGLERRTVLRQLALFETAA